MLSSVDEETVSCSCSTNAFENSITEQKNAKSCLRAVASMTLHQSKEAHKNEVRRKIVNKKVLKQARFLYKSKHLSSSANASSLLSQLDNLSLESSPTTPTKIHRKVLNSNSILSQSPITTPNQSNSTDCRKELSLLNLTSVAHLPSFCSLKQGNLGTITSRSLISAEEHRSSKLNKKVYARRRRDKNCCQILPEKVDRRNKHIKVASPFTPTTSSCAHEMHLTETNAAVNEIAAYMENYFVLPKKMSTMAEMMYT